MLTPAEHLGLVAVEVARIAAATVAESAGAVVAAATKTSPTDVVTTADFASETLIRRELLLRCPGSSIIGEEYDPSGGSNHVGWIVDPIDGTVNYLYDLPVVAVSIAAMIDGQVVAGAVADVHRSEIFSAVRGRGARRDGELINVSSQRSLDQCLIGTGFSYDATLRAAQATTVAGLLPRCRDIRCMGSAALNLCWVGCGRLDAYFERDLKIYDHAAGALVASEGGATVTGPGAQQPIVAATPDIHAELAALIASR